MTTLSYEELREYVDAFKTSSDRSRNALYIVVIATVLIAIAHYNTQPWSFARHRISTWHNTLSTQKAGAISPSSIKDNFPGNIEQLRIASDEYLKQYTDRAVLATSPIPGVWLDANDIGLFGGITLGLLMTVLVFCMMRERDNLHLALYKVRKLYEDSEGGDTEDFGNSKANFLYHALAMRQVLSSPPTLASYGKSPLLTVLTTMFFFSTFFLPTGGYLFVVLTNLVTKSAGRQYNMNISVLNGWQVALLILLASLSLASFLFSLEMTKQWGGAFRRINPQRRLLEQSFLPTWITTFRDRSKARYWQGKVIAGITKGIKNGDAPIPQAPIPIAKDLPITVPISKRDLNKMAEEILAEVTKQGGCTRDNLSLDGNIKITKNEIRDGNWTIEGTWECSL